MAERVSLHDFDQAVASLLEATRSLHSAVLGDREAVALDVALDWRETTFQALRRLAEPGLVPNAAARSDLSEIQSLDQEMLAHGIAEVGELRGRRQSVQRRRCAIQAHAKRERGEPRLLTVKA